MKTVHSTRLISIAHSREMVLIMLTRYFCLNVQVSFFCQCRLLPLLLNMLFYCHQNNGEKMGQSHILSVIRTVTVGTMLKLKRVPAKKGYV